MAFLFEKAFPSTYMHLYSKVRENHRWVVFTQQETIYLCTLSTHYFADNKLVSSVFSPMISFVSASKISFDFCHPIDSYSDICYLGTDELINFVSFLWMIWVNLPFLISERFVVLAQNSRFQWKRELLFGTRKKQENMRKL